MANYTLPFTGTQVEKAINLVMNSVAPAYNTSKSYVVGDTVVYNGLLYACVTNSSAGEFVPAKWQAVKIFDENGYLILNGGDSTN